MFGATYAFNLTLIIAHTISNVISLRELKDYEEFLIIKKISLKRILRRFVLATSFPPFLQIYRAFYAFVI
ncbi:MAG: hypothetical protein ACRENT_01050, partial [Thermodesulfobacteriota bacterium]